MTSTLISTTCSGTRAKLIRSDRRPHRSTLIFGALAAAALTGGCESCPSATPAFTELQNAPTTGCRLLGTGVRRATENPADSTQPHVALLGDGRHVLTWVEGRPGTPRLYVQRVGALTKTEGRPRRIPVEGTAHRPRVVAAGTGIVLAYGALNDTGHGEVFLQVLDEELQPLLSVPQSIGAVNVHSSVGVTSRDGKVLVALPRERQLELLTVTVSMPQMSPSKSDGGGTADAAPAPADGGGPSDGGTVEAGPGGDEPTLAIERQTMELPEEMADLGNVDILARGERLFFVSDTPGGWSIQLAEINDDAIEKVAQVVDDRRHPELTWVYPSLGPIRHDGVAILWQGPSDGVSSLYFLGFEPDGTAMGRVQLFEAIQREEEDEQNVLGRAPAFDPALAQTPTGLLIASADNRYGNTEIILAPLGCGD